MGQHLLDYRTYDAPPELHYWVREKTGSQAEVDYVISRERRAVPIEVQAGPSARAKSLQVFLQEKDVNTAIHFSTALPEIVALQNHAEPKILWRLPYYMASCLKELLLRPK